MWLYLQEWLLLLLSCFSHVFKFIFRFVETESRMVVTRYSEERIKGSYIFIDIWFCKMKKFWRLDAQKYEYTSHFWTACLKMVMTVNFMLYVFYLNLIFKKGNRNKVKRKGQRKKRNTQPYTYIVNQNYFFKTAQIGKRTSKRNGL